MTGKTLLRKSILLVFLSSLLLGSGSDAWASTEHARIDSLVNLGRGFVLSNIDESAAMYGALAEEAREIDYPTGEARALQLQGVALYLGGQLEEGVEVSLKAIRMFEELGLRQETALTYGDLGFHMKRRDADRSADFMRRGMAIAEEDADSVALGTLYNNYGVVQEMADKPDSAIYYYQLALDYKTALHDSLGIPFSLNNLAGLAASQGRLADAEDLMTRSDAIRRILNDIYGLVMNRIQWAELAFLQGDLAVAVERYEAILQIPDAFEHDRMVSYCYERLAAIYEQEADFERAFHNQLRFAAYRDSLFDVENNSRMAALELEFETEKKDRQLAESQLAIAARTRQLTILGAVLAVLVVVGVGIMGFQHLKRRQLQQELELKGRLRRAEYQERMAAEKLRISRELHDNIGAQLTFITSSIDNVSHRMDADEVRRDLDAIGSFGRSTLGELRQTVWAMKAEGEGFDGLVAKLQELKRQCRSTGRQLDFTARRDADVEVDLSSGRMLNVYRIAQEAVQNALKHTDDGTITMDLTADSGGMALAVRDEGPGFDTGSVQHAGGLTHMRQRCGEAGGEFSLSSDATGTEITCRFTAE